MRINFEARSFGGPGGLRVRCQQHSQADAAHGRRPANLTARMRTIPRTVPELSVRFRRNSPNPSSLNPQKFVEKLAGSRFSRSNHSKASLHPAPPKVMEALKTTQSQNSYRNTPAINISPKPDQSTATSVPSSSQSPMLTSKFNPSSASSSPSSSSPPIRLFKSWPTPARRSRKACSSPFPQESEMNLHSTEAKACEVRDGHVVNGIQHEIADESDHGGVQDKLVAPGVTVVRTRRQLARALEALYANPDKFHACDTEVADIDVKKVGPVGNGRVICVSIYSGPDVDFGGGKGKALWVDTMGENKILLQDLKGWFEDPRYKKVWHNYGFDRHVLYNMGIDARGFAGDTMHMARLWDTSREKRLSARLTTNVRNSAVDVGGADESGDADQSSSSTFGKGYSLEALTLDLIGRRKVPMVEIFGVPRLKKDGSPGKILDLPPVEELQNKPETREKWIEYSAYDAEGTWLLHRELMAKLMDMRYEKGLNMFDFYSRYLVPFGELLTDMERDGIYVDTKFLKEAEETARKVIRDAEFLFHRWAVSKVGDVGWYINPGSGPQIQTLLFGGSVCGRAGTTLPQWREFKIPASSLQSKPTDSNRILEEDMRSSELAVEDLIGRMTAAEARNSLRDFGLKLSGKKEELQERLVRAISGNLLDSDKGKKKKAKEIGEEQEGKGDLYELENTILEELRARNTQPKFMKINITGLGIPVKQTTAKGLPAVDASALRELSGDEEENWENGRLYNFFRCKDEGLEACRAIGALRTVGTVGAMITNFLVPLQVLADKDQRIHCSLNLNTETGRLSSRRPNLQNQPALEKDQYRVREAFRAEQGNTLVVADYGQLELRILAHLTGCKSMIEAFESGADFHSSTAVDMFPHVRAAVDSGEVLLEWNGNGPPPKPLVKDKYGSERRKAKTLNFSIVYGKTVQGLSKDWGVSLDEAQELLDKWYAARPEVLQWQQETIDKARKTGYARTLMGRYRALPEMRHSSKWVRAHGERAAINSPVQGGAADVVMMAMIKLHQSPVLRFLNYKLLLQVHDEVILEGPEEHADAALKEVVSCLTTPFDGAGLKPLRVALDVDAKYAKSWYEAK
eukprot:CAMPEP_0184502572 /NCGR_PEP_ID=MMETSP0113_2-20130426/50732_1 /TAXON_ID=91329 /ORGANISM="Norrisiella sphaerica, Strain BC52" /LENGTH=1086 /DNA_ID=CAMNT_0026891819 /DNA_START=240 /DNA_END=3500 /DNA_ORIENTATION=-